MLSDMMVHMVDEFNVTSPDEEGSKECACFTMYYLEFLLPFLRRNTDPSITADSMWEAFIEVLETFTE